MSKKLIAIFVVIAISLTFITGCESDAQTGTLLGTAAGAGLGQAIGRDTKSTLIGGGIGAAAGYFFGNERDKKKAKAQEQAEISRQLGTTTVWITNSNGSKSPVRLTVEGPNYVGPRGEYYDHLPSEEELRPLYGR